MNIVEREDAPGGYWLKVEVPNAYTDGSSRFERRFVSRARIEGKTAEQIQQALSDAVTSDPLAPFIGQTVSTPTQTKAIIWERAKAAYADWQMAKTTRIEAQARALPAVVITALQNAEDTTWGNYVTTLNQWRLAPA